MALGFRFAVSRRPECCGSPMKKEMKKETNGETVSGWKCIVNTH